MNSLYFANADRYGQKDHYTMKEPLEVLVLERQIIKLYNETDYEFDSATNFKTYSKTFISGDKDSLTSLIGIELFEDDELKSSCLIGCCKRCQWSEAIIYLRQTQGQIDLFEKFWRLSKPAL